MRIKAFTLIELIIVIIIFGVASYLVTSSIHSSTKESITPDKFREVFKNTTIYMFRDNFLILNNKNVKIKLTNPIVYDKDLKEIEFQRYKDKKVIFKYVIHNGIQNSYILECNEGIFVFKPLETIKVDSLQKAQEILTYKDYLPEDGNYYK